MPFSYIQRAVKKSRKKKGVDKKGQETFFLKLFCYKKKNVNGL